MHYRKKLVLVDAIQFTGDNFTDVMEFAGKGGDPGRVMIAKEPIPGGLVTPGAPVLDVKTTPVVAPHPMGWSLAETGRWILRRPDGRLEVVDPRVFAAEYEPDPDHIHTRPTAPYAVPSADTADQPAPDHTGVGSPPTNYHAMTQSELAEYCGADAGRWAAAFAMLQESFQGADAAHTVFYGEGVMIAWFAAAIEAATDARDRANAAPRPNPPHKAEDWPLETVL